ncbi:MAG: trimethylamine methyltransferase family protein [Clostridiales bacterium]
MKNNKSHFINHQPLQFGALNQDQCEQIVNATFRTLEKVGCKVQSEEALDLLKNAGCHIEGELVKIPAHVMKKAINTAPSSVTLYDREGEVAMNVEPNNVYFGPGMTNPLIVDSETGERRATIKSDVANMARVCEALPNIDWVCGLASISDCNPCLAEVYEAREVLENTSKHLVSWTHNLENCVDIVKMCATAIGGMDKLKEKPFLSFWISPVSPLTQPKDSIAPVLYLAGEGLPVMYISGQTMGGTAPISFGGGMVVGLADCLVGLLISQLKREGTPFICGSFCEYMNMKTVNMSFSNPELAFSQAAASDIFRYLDLPFAIHAGTTDSPIFDQQAAGDIAIQLFTGALSRGNMNCFIGFLESAMSASLEAVVYGDEMISYIHNIVAGAEISTDTLVEDVIANVGPGGNYLTEPHTFENFKKLWTPQCLQRDNYDNWVAAEKPDLFTILNKKVKELIATAPQKPLDDDILKQLDDIINKAEARYSTKH